MNCSHRRCGISAGAGRMRHGETPPQADCAKPSPFRADFFNRDDKVTSLGHYAEEITSRKALRDDALGKR